jgi:hypothetical protein
LPRAARQLGLAQRIPAFTGHAGTVCCDTSQGAAHMAPYTDRR